MLSVIAVLSPAAFHFVAGSQMDDMTEGREILAVSRGVCFMTNSVFDCFFTVPYHPDCDHSSYQ
jgi:Ca2+:H+ antiporter